MRGYGLPRRKSLESPDLVDIQEFGLKSSKSRIRNISGDFKNSFRSSVKKKAARRVWKKRERLLNKIKETEM
jgi:hypothetical protein